MNQTIHSLRKQGYKVRVTHLRNYYSDFKLFERQREPIFKEPKEKYTIKESGFQINPKGGRTVVELRSPEGIEVVGGVNCYYKDTYNKKKGVTMALGRAWGALLKIENVNKAIECLNSPKSAFSDLT